MTRKIAVAIGDPNGIGPEIAVKAAAQLSGSAIEPILVGDEFVIRAYLERHASGATDRIRLAPVDALDSGRVLPRHARSARRRGDRGIRAKGL